MTSYNDQINHKLQIANHKIKPTTDVQNSKATKLRNETASFYQDKTGQEKARRENTKKQQNLPNTR